MKKDERLLIGKDHIITHRGLEPSRSNYFSESSLEAFKDQLSRGFGGIMRRPWKHPLISIGGFSRGTTLLRSGLRDWRRDPSYHSQT